MRQILILRLEKRWIPTIDIESFRKFVFYRSPNHWRIVNILKYLCFWIFRNKQKSKTKITSANPQLLSHFRRSFMCAADDAYLAKSVSYTIQIEHECHTKFEKFVRLLNSSIFRTTKPPWMLRKCLDICISSTLFSCSEHSFPATPACFSDVGRKIKIRWIIHPHLFRGQFRFFVQRLIASVSKKQMGHCSVFQLICSINASQLQQTSKSKLF